MQKELVGYVLFLVTAGVTSVASAQLVTEDMTVTVGSVAGGSAALQSSLIGTTGSGTFTYDSSLVTGSGFESINAGQGLTLELTVFGQTFTEANDRDLASGVPPDFPVLSFNDGQPFGIGFRVLESPLTNNPTAIALPGVEFFEFDSIFSPNGSGGFESSLFVLAGAVPEPTSQAMAFTLTLSLLACRRRR